MHRLLSGGRVIGMCMFGDIGGHIAILYWDNGKENGNQLLFRV